MIVKRGSVVSHSGAVEWGIGKVVELSSLKATIQFNDGTIRKVASSHYNVLQPADPNSFVPIMEKVMEVKLRASAKGAAKKRVAVSSRAA